MIDTNKGRMMQCAFSRPTDTGRRRVTGWIPFDDRIKPGWSVELIEGDRRELWVVDEVFGARDRTDIKRGWNNNI